MLEVQDKTVEILGFREDDIEVMHWEYKHSIEIGAEMYVKEENRPKGMGGSTLMKRIFLIENASHLIELSVDKVTEGGEGELICKTVARRSNKAIERQVKIPEYLSKEWASWDGDEFTHIFTDGYYKEEATWGEQLLGNAKEQAGGAIILSDGQGWF
jgi:hypothetical protein